MTDHLDPSDPASSPSPDQWDALGRFLAGESSAGDAADIRQWLSEHPGDAQVVATLDGLLPPSAQDFQLAPNRAEGTLQFGRPIDVEGALKRVHAQMETTGSSLSLTAIAEPRFGAPRKIRAADRAVAPGKRSWSRAIGIAAAAAAAAAVGITQWPSGKAIADAAPQVYTASAGSSDSVLLSDSSRVILAPGSQLTVASAYGRGNRAVQLQGTAQFTVRHDAKRPFSVRSGAAIINDLGTVFTVKADGGKGLVVAVTEGSVSMSDSSAAGRTKAITLAAGDRGRLRTDGTLVTERGSVTPDESAWVVGKLVYVDAPWAEVKADLEHWYGVKLVVADSLSEHSINTQILVRSETVEKVVQRLAASWSAVVTKRADTLFVERSGDRQKH
ncbi:MAG: FecR domain-containing protein [Gemmatimonas sp.]